MSGTSSKQKRWLIVLIIVGIVALYQLAGYSGRFWVKDAGGETRHSVSRMDTREQYGLMSDRMHELWHRTEKLQLEIHAGEWKNEGIGRILPGPMAPFGQIAGMTGKNSYYLVYSKGFSPEGATGDPKDLDQFEAFARKQGWKYEIGSFGEKSVEHFLVAETGDGWYVDYIVRWNGYYTLDVYSGVYWGDRREVQQERLAREFDRGPEYSVPGIHPEFPSWDAPRSERKSLSE